MPEGTELVRIGMVDYGAKAWTTSYGRLLPADVSILCKGAQVLASLNKKCREGNGMDLQGPAADFANLAKSFSLYGGGPILEPNDIAAALKRGLKVVKDGGRLALIDTVAQPR